MSEKQEWDWKKPCPKCGSIGCNCWLSEPPHRPTKCDICGCTEIQQQDENEIQFACGRDAQLDETWWFYCCECEHTEALLAEARKERDAARSERDAEKKGHDVVWGDLVREQGAAIIAREHHDAAIAQVAELAAHLRRAVMYYIPHSIHHEACVLTQGCAKCDAESALARLKKE